MDGNIYHLFLLKDLIRKEVGRKFKKLEVTKTDIRHYIEMHKSEYAGKKAERFAEFVYRRMWNRSLHQLTEVDLNNLCQLLDTIKTYSTWAEFVKDNDDSFARMTEIYGYSVFSSTQIPFDIQTKIAGFASVTANVFAHVPEGNVEEMAKPFRLGQMGNEVISKMPEGSRKDIAKTILSMLTNPSSNQAKKAYVIILGLSITDIINRTTFNVKELSIVIYIFAIVACIPISAYIVRTIIFWKAIFTKSKEILDADFKYDITLGNKLTVLLSISAGFSILFVWLKVSPKYPIMGGIIVFVTLFFSLTYLIRMFNKRVFRTVQELKKTTEKRQ